MNTTRNNLQITWQAGYCQECHHHFGIDPRFPKQMYCAPCIDRSRLHLPIIKKTRPHRQSDFPPGAILKMAIKSGVSLRSLSVELGYRENRVSDWNRRGILPTNPTTREQLFHGLKCSLKDLLEEAQ